MTTIQQTMPVPADRPIRFDMPRDVPAGTAATAKITLAPPLSPAMRLSESALAKEWDTPEEDAAWETL